MNAEDERELDRQIELDNQRMLDRREEALENRRLRRRDLFAAAALTGILAAGPDSQNIFSPRNAIEAWEIADLVLEKE